MNEVDAFLKERLAGVRRLAVLGAGSVLRADDAAGVQVVENLREAFPEAENPNLLLCVGETAPENYSGRIAGFAPEHLLLIDAADVGEEAGKIVEIRPGDVGGPTFCSHMLPLRVMVDYIQSETNAGVTLLGIQYKSTAFDGEMSFEVGQAVEALSGALIRIIRKMVG